MSARTTIRRLATIGAAGAASALLGVAPVSAEVDHAHETRTLELRAQQKWLDNPAVVPSPKTSRTHTSGNGTAQIRFGTYKGIRYGWGRAVNTDGDHWIRFEVDIDGDRSWDEYEAWRIKSRVYTSGYPTSPSSARAFRACVVADHDDGCVSGKNGTRWW